jgi:hypothetical protein
MRRALLLAPALLLLPAIACTAEAIKPAPAIGRDAGAADAKASPADAASPNAAGDSSGECNTIQNLGSPVTPTPKSGSMPSGAGGAPADGTYVLTGVDLYGGAAFPTVAATYQVKGTLLVTVSSFPDTGETSRDNLVMIVSGTTGTQRSTCASSAEGTFDFTATASEMRFALPDASGGGVVLTLTKR